MINFSNFLILAVFTYFINYVVNIIFNKKERLKIKNKNMSLEALRNIRIKSLEEQKKFLDIKYEKKVFKFSWSWFKGFILYGVQYAFIFYTMFIIFQYFNLNFNFWHAILFIFCFPIIMNFILRKFNVQKDDLTVFIRK